MHLADTKHTHSPYMPGVERWSLYRSLWNRYAREFIVTYATRFGTRWGEFTAEKKGELKKLIEWFSPSATEGAWLRSEAGPCRGEEG